MPPKNAHAKLNPLSALSQLAPQNLSRAALMMGMEGLFQQSLLSASQLLPTLKQNWPNWNNPWNSLACPLQQEAQNALKPWENHLQNEEVQSALAKILEQRTEELSHGIDAYFSAKRPAPRKRSWAQTPLWQLGTSQLYLHPATRKTNKAPVLLVPSLINRWHILDLMRGHSLVEWLAGHGHDVFVIDWDEPEEEELSFGVADYVERRLVPAMQACRRFSSRKPHVFGYCMGGALALAAAARHQHLMQSLILLATPWDFDVPLYERSSVPEAMRPMLAHWIEAQPSFPAEWLDAMFYLSDPWRVHRKFRQLPKRTSQSAAYKLMLAVEDWVHDGVALSPRVASECLVDWGMDNGLKRGSFLWRGRALKPESIEIPTLVISPLKDQVVPHASSEPLAATLGNGYTYSPHAGHVSLLVGKQREAMLYDPLEEWLEFTA